jgi:polysaccharide export outer membrane protein
VVKSGGIIVRRLAVLLLMTMASTGAFAQAAVEYQIGLADMLHISVWKNESVSRTVQVRPDGKISLPLVNDVRAAGLTPMQLRTEIRKRLRDYIPNAEISVIVVEIHSFVVSVLGEVRSAGRYELQSEATVLDMLALAGGITEFASSSRIFVLRPEGGEMKRIPFNYNKVIDKPDEHQIFSVRPGDIVVVP